MTKTIATFWAISPSGKSVQAPVHQASRYLKPEEAQKSGMRGVFEAG